MTDAERFGWAVEVSDSELIAEAARGSAAGAAVSDGQVQMIAQNVLLYPKMVALLRKIGMGDTSIGLAMLDPHAFADEMLADAEAPERGEGR